MLARVAVHVLVGGMAAALGGAFCIAVAGALTGWILGGVDGMGIGFVVGLGFGSGGGGLAGALIHAINGFCSAPGRSLVPRRRFLVSIGIGQILGTLGICSGFFGVAGLVARLWPRGGTFTNLVGGHIVWIMYGAPVIMICGEIAGALVAFREQNRPSRAASPLPPPRG